MPAQLVDIGVNLGHRQFGHDREDVINRAVAAGVGVMVVTGTNVRASQDAQRLAAAHPNTLYCTAGVHPHNSRDCDATTIPNLRRLAARPEVVAIGECGLDYNRDFSPRPLQDQWFEEQIKLARDLKMPLFLHERDAHERFVEILSPYISSLPAAVVHCFTGTARELDAYLALGLHIGITGWISDTRRGIHLLSLVRRIPLDRLMLETDAPFLTPQNLPFRPADRRNEPAFLPYVLDSVARAYGKSTDEVAAATTATARAFFNLSEG